MPRICATALGFFLLVKRSKKIISKRMKVRSIQLPLGWKKKEKKKLKIPSRRYSASEYDLDVDIIGDLDPHERTKSPVVGIEIYQPLVDAHLPTVPGL